MPQVWGNTPALRSASAYRVLGPGLKNPRFSKRVMVRPGCPGSTTTAIPQELTFRHRFSYGLLTRVGGRRCHLSGRIGRPYGSGLAGTGLRRVQAFGGGAVGYAGSTLEFVPKGEFVDLSVTAPMTGLVEGVDRSEQSGHVNRTIIHYILRKSVLTVFRMFRSGAFGREGPATEAARDSFHRTSVSLNWSLHKSFSSYAVPCLRGRSGGRWRRRRAGSGGSARRLRGRLDRR